MIVMPPKIALKTGITIHEIVVVRVIIRTPVVLRLHSGRRVIKQGINGVLIIMSHSSRKKSKTSLWRQFSHVVDGLLQSHTSRQLMKQVY